MANQQSVFVFATFKPLQRILTIYDWKNFQSQDRPVLIRHIRNAIVVALLLLNFLLGAYADISFCLDNNLDLNKIALPAAILITSPQIIVSYIAITVKSDLVNEVIGNLKEMVKKRKFF